MKLKRALPAMTQILSRAMWPNDGPWYETWASGNVRNGVQMLAVKTGSLSAALDSVGHVLPVFLEQHLRDKSDRNRLRQDLQPRMLPRQFIDARKSEIW